jgi:hypothetical protein
MTYEELTKLEKKIAMNVVRCFLLPIVLYFAIYYTCYEIFWWATVEEDSPWTRSLNGGAGRSTPIAEAMRFGRELVNARR